MAILTTLSVVLGVVDAQIASFFALVPGAKIGLANIVIMLSIIHFSFRDGILMAILKSLLIGLMLGALTTFLIGFSGTMLSFIGMYFVYNLFNKNISIIGVSVIGGVLHALGQVTAVVVFYQTSAAVMFIPQLLLLSVVTGVVTGMITNTVTSYLVKLTY